MSEFLLKENKSIRNDWNSLNSFEFRAKQVFNGAVLAMKSKGPLSLIDLPLHNGHR